MIEIHDLVKVYPNGVAALRGVNLDIPQGMFGLLGPNGSGKTTLMRILAGLLEPTSGRIIRDGRDITRTPEAVWSTLGYLPQDYGFYPRLTGRAMLMHLLALKGVHGPNGRAALCEALLARVNLSAAADRRIMTYSGGMRQRLGIAQAIAGDPALVIVDEPTAGLDPEERLRFYRLLAELAESRTVILSTHIVDDVAMLCPRFAIIRAGAVIRQTTPGEARAAIEGHIYEGCVERDGLEAVSRVAQVTSAHLVEGRNRLRVHVPDGSPPAGFTPGTATLEDAYMVLVAPPPPPQSTGSATGSA